MMHEKSPKVAKSFSCILCYYECSKESDFNKHLMTRKHNRNDALMTKSQQGDYTCKCGKVYKYRQGLSVHKKKCEQNITVNIEEVEQTTISIIDANASEPNVDNKNIIELLIKENSEFKNIVL